MARIAKTRTNEEMLQHLLRCNKVYRQTLAVKAGFADYDAYKAYLLRPVKPVKVDKKKTVVEKVVEKVKEAVKPSKKASKKEESKVEALDMVIAFDTTGSMRNYISDVKKHVTALVDKMIDENPELKIKVVAFGDYCDMNSKTKFGKAYQEIELTNDKKKLVSFIQGAKNTDGGDGDEFYELVIKKVTAETQWRKGVKRTFLLIGDWNPHEVGYTHHKLKGENKIDWKKEIKNAAKENIQIDTLACGTSSLSFYQEVSRVTGGIHLPFSKSQNVNQVVESLSYAKSNNAAAYRGSLAKAEASGDKELLGAIKSMITLL